MKGLSLKLSVSVPNLVLAVMLLTVYAGNDQVVGGKNSQELTYITANKTSFGHRANERIFEGNVALKQADVSLSCDKLIIAHDEENRSKKLPKDLGSSAIRSITASGNVRMSQRDWKATADKAFWDDAKRTVTFTEGSPRIWNGSDTFSARTIVIYLDENRVELGGWHPEPYQAKENKKQSPR